MSSSTAVLTFTLNDSQKLILDFDPRSIALETTLPLKTTESVADRTRVRVLIGSGWGPAFEDPIYKDYEAAFKAQDIDKIYDFFKRSLRNRRAAGLNSFERDFPERIDTAIKAKIMQNKTNKSASSSSTGLVASYLISPEFALPTAPLPQQPPTMLATPVSQLTTTTPTKNTSTEIKDESWLKEFALEQQWQEAWKKGEKTAAAEIGARFNFNFSPRKRVIDTLSSEIPPLADLAVAEAKPKKQETPPYLGDKVQQTIARSDAVSSSLTTVRRCRL